MALDDHGNSVLDASIIAVNQVLDGHLDAEGDLDVFRLDLPAAGVVAVEVSAPGGAPAARPGLRYLGTDGPQTATGVVTVKRTATRHLLRARTPETLYFGVASRAAGSTGDGTYRLHVAFVDQEDPDRSPVFASLTDPTACTGRWVPEIGVHKLDEGMEEWEEDNGVNQTAQCPAGECPGDFYKLDEGMEEWEEDNGVNQTAQCLSPGLYKLDEGMEEWEEDNGANQTGACLPADCYKLDEGMEEWEEDNGANQTGTCPPADLYKRGEIRTAWLCGADGSVAAIKLRIAEPGVVEVAGAASETVHLLAAVRPGAYLLRLPPEESGWEALAVRFFAPCSRTDDHHEALGCASELALGAWLAAEIRSDAGADRDTFSFVLSRRETLLVESLGDLDAFGELFAADGTLVASDDNRGGEGNFRITARLGPGRYYLRVSAIGGGEGSYSLRSNSLR